MKKVTAVDCVPLNLLLHKAHVRHINFFILDVEASSCQQYCIVVTRVHAMIQNKLYDVILC